MINLREWQSIHRRGIMKGQLQMRLLIYMVSERNLLFFVRLDGWIRIPLDC